MSLKNVYVIVAANFEYNDNYYYSTDGGHPVKFYTSQEDAVTACQKMNDDQRMQVDPEDYRDGHDDVDINDIDFYYVVTVPVG